VIKLVKVVPQIKQDDSEASFSERHQCQILATRGHELETSYVAAEGENPGVTINIRRQWPILGRCAISISHARALRRKAADIVHSRSLRRMVIVAAGWMVPGQHAKLVTSPLGTLSSWALGRTQLPKRILWSLQRPALVQCGLAGMVCGPLIYLQPRNKS
jgi:hypothetical protein